MIEASFIPRTSFTAKFVEHHHIRQTNHFEFQDCVQNHARNYARNYVQNFIENVKERCDVSLLSNLATSILANFEWLSRTASFICFGWDAADLFRESVK